MLKRIKGFTLIELLIVVAIIGILAAIAIPQFATYRKKAQQSSNTTSTVSPTEKSSGSATGDGQTVILK